VGREWVAAADDWAAALRLDIEKSDCSEVVESSTAILTFDRRRLLEMAER